MKQVEFLTKQYGEFHYTPRSLYEVYVGQEYDKELMADTIISNDNWMPHPKKMFAVETYEIPEWMTPEEYIEQEINWKYFVKIGGTEDMGREVYFRLISIKDGALRLACVKLFKTKKFRSELRKSLREQLEKWISDTHSKFNSPFSIKQQKVLINTYLLNEAKRLGVIA